MYKCNAAINSRSNKESGSPSKTIWGIKFCSWPIPFFILLQLIYTMCIPQFVFHDTFIPELSTHTFLKIFFTINLHLEWCQEIKRFYRCISSISLLRDTSIFVSHRCKNIIIKKIRNQLLYYYYCIVSRL